MTKTGISVARRPCAKSLSMADIADHSLPHLPRAAARLGAVFARPKTIATALRDRAGGCSAGSISESCPANSTPAASGLWSWIAALCRPAVAPLSSEFTQFILIATMWSAMALAMMLPSAAPMILTYAEIADTAARKGEPVVSPFALALGYAAIWIAFALLAATLQIGADERRTESRTTEVTRLAASREFSSSWPGSINSRRSSNPACASASGRFRFSSPIGERQSAACSASACGKDCIASAAAGR